MERKDIIYGDKIKLDDKDKKILYALYEDARMPISKISKKTGIQRDSIVYRIKKMLKEEIISFFGPVINPSKLGYSLIHLVLLKIQIKNEKVESKFLQYLKKNNFITSITIISGKWDYELTICSKNPLHFNKILKEIKSFENNFILDIEVMMMIKEPKYEFMLNLI